MKKTIFLFLLLLVSANADWIEVGVAISCNKDNNSFEILSTVETSDANSNVEAPSGFRNLNKGRGQHHECMLGSTKIELDIDVYGPQAKGMGQGAGVMIINNLKVNNQNIIKNRTNFNWQVMNEQFLTEVHIKKNNELIKVSQCITDGWSWESSYENKKCKDTTLNFEDNKSE